jgi:formylmethanofuran dehydrogenase subunit E
VHLETGKAYRVVSTEESRELAAVYAPEIAGRYPQQLEAYKRMPDSVLFRVHEVRVKLSELDLPGPTRRKVACAKCGQVVRDGRELMADGVPLCIPCGRGAYFEEIREIPGTTEPAANPSSQVILGAPVLPAVHEGTKPD